MLETRKNGARAVGARSRGGRGVRRGSEHFVQFYESDGFLLSSLSGFIGEGLGAGEGCVVVAGRSRREGLEERLRASGVDVDGASARGQYFTLDAADTLSEFMTEGWPEPERFRDLVGGVLSRAAADGRRVRVFGDMVAQLCGEQRHAAAVQLERLWNELQQAQPFTLFCAYPLGNFEGSAHAGSFDEICAAHTRVVPAESYARRGGHAERARTVALLQQRARALEAEIAERRQAEEALRASLAERDRLLRREQAARREAEEASRLKDQFLATVSHELRTPLTAILGWSQVLNEGRLTGEAAERALATIERNARAQNQLIGDLLDMSRIITGKLRLEARPVSAEAFVDAAVETMRPAAVAKGVSLRKVVRAGPCEVSGDPDRLQQVVWNLLSNAIKFTPEGGSVEARLEETPTHVSVVVSDTGEGIPSEFLPFVFDRFRQGDGTTTRLHGGLGLGLSIVRHLVELHGGTVRAESSGEGRGASFVVRLPRLRSADAGPRVKEESGAAAGEESAVRLAPSETLAGLRALIVDDEDDTCELLRVMLRQRGAEVLTASTAAQALAELERSRPDLLISDIGMPGADGYQLIRDVRRLPAERGGRVPAVALTAYARAEDRLRALRAGYQTHVPKPIEPDELIAVVANLMARG